MKNFTHHKHEGDSLCGTSAINLTTKQHLVNCPKCLEIKPYKVKMPEKKVIQKNRKLSYNNGITLYTPEFVTAVWHYYLQNKENSYVTISKIFDLTPIQAEAIISNQFRRR